MSGKVYDSHDLNSEFIFLAFDFFPERGSSLKLNDAIKSYSNITSFICFANDDMLGENTILSSFEIVNFNSSRFQEKFNIITPVAFLLDKNKRVIAKVYRDNLNDLDKYLKH